MDMAMKKEIAIIGGSSAGLLCALSLSRRKDLSITIFEKNDRLGKKLNATGNGHCNLLPSILDASFYNNNEYMGRLFKKFSLDKLIDFYSSNGIPLLNKNGLYYPYSFSSKSLNEYIVTSLKNTNVNIRLNEKLISYNRSNRVQIKTDKGNYEFDKLIFALGGKSQQNLGSDGSLLPLFKQKGYVTRDYFPTLCPIKTKEKTVSIDGKRHHGLVTLLKNGKQIYQEDGEVLFKKDGVSGIAIFNCSFFIDRDDCSKYKIKIDLFPELEEKELTVFLTSASKNGYTSIFEKEILSFLSLLLKQNHKDINDSNLANISKNLYFQPSSLYGFDSSQVSSGGICLDSLNEDLSSKIEKDVYFIGEMVDINGICGGYNLAWCLISSLLVIKNI